MPANGRWDLIRRLKVNSSPVRSLLLRAACQSRLPDQGCTPDVAKICHRKRCRRCRVALPRRGGALACSSKPQSVSRLRPKRLVSCFDCSCYPPQSTGINFFSLLHEGHTFLVPKHEGLYGPRLRYK